jgi:hypothetical protein
MKRIKIMLTAITVFAVVGGALAFKAQKFGKVIYTTNNPVPGATCPFAVVNFTTTQVADPLFPNKISVTDIQNNLCVLRFTTPQN